MAEGRLCIRENRGVLVVGLLSTLFKPAERQSTKATTILDAIFYLAGLASNPADIDPLLDKVRKITVTDEVFSAADTLELMRVYLQIEEYLETKEPLRTFTKEELRARLSPELQLQIEEYQIR